MYRLVETSLWGDPKVRALDANTKLAFVYLLTNMHTHVGGIYYLPPLYASVESGIPIRAWTTSLDTLSEVGFLSYDKTTEIVWVKNMFNYQGRGIKNDLAVARHIKTLHHSWLIEEFLNHYPNVQNSLQAQNKMYGSKVKTNLRFKVLERDQFTCQYCGVKAPTVQLEVDHRIPRSQGGKTELANLATVCFECNHGKQDTLSETRPQDQEKDQEQEKEKDQKQEQEKEKEKKEDGLSVNWIVGEWNEIEGVSKVRKIEPGMGIDRVVRTRLKTYGSKEWWSDLFTLIKGSDFLSGRKTDFRATLDWALGPKNLGKILAGNYENRPGRQGITSGISKRIQELKEKGS